MAITASQRAKVYRNNKKNDRSFKEKLIQIIQTKFKKDYPME